MESINSTVNLCFQNILGSFNNLLKSVVLSLLLFIFSTASAQQADIDQGANGGLPCSGACTIEWVNGNVNASKAHYIENYSVPYRMKMTGLTLATHTLQIEWDITKGGKHALDYITSMENINDPLHLNAFGHAAEDVYSHALDAPGTFTGLTVGTFKEYNLYDNSSGTNPNPVTYSNAPLSIGGQPAASIAALSASQKRIRIWGGTITGLTFVPAASHTGDQSEGLIITFTATNVNVVIGWGGHIGSQADWGVANSAVNISGSPYHTRLVALDGSGGSQDRSLAAVAVYPPPPCTISTPNQFICAGQFPVQFTGPAPQTGLTYSWTSSPAGLTLAGNTTQTVSITAGTPGLYTLTLITSQNLVNSIDNCQVNLAINANPAALVLTGSSVCTSASGTGSITSTTSVAGVSYQLKNSGGTNVQAAQAGTGSGLTWSNVPAGTGYYVIATGAAPTNCTSQSNAVNVVEAPSPAALVLTGSSVCTSASGTGSITSTTSVVGVNYQLYNSSNATFQAAQAGSGSGLTWSNVAAGTGYYVIATGDAPNNCTSQSNAVTVAEVANPAALVLSGSAICASTPNTGTITSTTSVSGVSYQLYNNLNATVQAAQAGTGSGLTWTNLAAGSGYYVIGSAGTAPNTCTSQSNAVTVAEVANPAALVLSGSAICASAPNTSTITSTTSAIGVSYQLYNNLNATVQTAKMGTGSGLTWTNLAAGTGYYVIGTAGTVPNTCTSQSNAVTVAEVANPAALVLSGSAICTSAPNTGTITSTTSVSGVSYQLYNNLNTTVQGAKAGTGSGLTWTNLAAGSGYYVIGSAGTAPNTCTSQSNAVTVAEVANPAALVLSGSAICASAPNTGTITSTTSAIGVSYQLYNNLNATVQTAKMGTGSGLAWTSIAAGTGYYVIGTAGTAPNTCTSQSNAVNVTEKPIPTTMASNNGPICAGGTFSISASNSLAGATFSWTGPNNFMSNVQNPPAFTNATTAMAGTYTVTVSLNECSSTFQTIVSVVPNPTIYLLSFTSYCSGGSGTGSATLSGSQTGVSYTLMMGANAVLGQPVLMGTGGTLSWFGLQSGTYYVSAKGPAPTNCTSVTATVTIAPYALPVVTADNKSVCSGSCVQLTGTPAGGTWSGTGVTGSQFCSTGLSPGTYQVTYSYTNTLNGCSNSKNATITIGTQTTGPIAGHNSRCGAGMVELSASGCNGTLKWYETSSSTTVLSNNTTFITPTLTMTNTYYVSCTVGNCESARTPVTATVKLIPITTASNNGPICVGGTFTIAATSYTNAGFNWTGPNNFTFGVQNPPAFTNASTTMAGQYTVTVSLNGCSSMSSTTVAIVENPAVYTVSGSAYCAGSLAKGSVTLNSSQTGVSYQLINASLVNVQSAQAGTGSGLTWTGLDAGVYKVRATGTAPTNCSSLTDGATVTENPLPNTVADSKTICLGDCVTLTGTPAGGTWSGTGVSGSQFCSTGLAAGSYSVVYSVTNSGTGCSSSKTATITVSNCGGPICTYTQGYYGNANGKSCDGTTGGFSTDALITKSLTNYPGGMLVIGKMGRSVVLTNTAAARQCIIDKLPGGGSSKELSANDFSICNLPASYLKNGRINNVFLSQTIALGLNIGITSLSTLGSFTLQAGALATAMPDGGCGSSVPKTRVCIYNTIAPYQLLSVTNEYTYRTISMAIYNAITPKTVSGLMELANRALANTDGIVGSENGVSLSDIASAVAAINEVFDECRIFIGWNVGPCAPNQAPLSPTRITLTQQVDILTSKLSISTYPNPFKDQVKFEIKSPVSGNGKIEVYNMTGQRMATINVGQVFAGKVKNLNYIVPPASRANMIYKLTVGTEKVAGIMINMK